METVTHSETTQPSLSSQPQLNQDEEHLRLLVIFHYVVAGLHALFALFPLIHVVIGATFILNPCAGPDCPPPFFGWIFLGIGSFLILLGESLAVVTFLNGRAIAKRKRHTTCIVLSAVECLIAPLGTILGVFSLIVLNRPSVKALFADRSQAV